MSALVKVSLRYGVLGGIIGSILLTVLFYLDRHPFLIPVYLDFRIILFVIFILYSLKELRDYHQNGVLYFWQGFIASFLFITLYAAISTLFILAFIAFEPDFLSEYIKLQIEQLRSIPPDRIESIGEDVYERNLELLPKTNAAQLGVTYFVQSFAIGLFISIILSVTLRRQPNLNP